MLALIDATMSDLSDEVDPNAHTVFAPEWAEDMTEVNLDLKGALEACVEAETRLMPASRGAIPLDFARVEYKPPHTVNHRVRPNSNSYAGDLSNIVEEEFDMADDLPMLDSGEFLAVPPTDDLTLGRRPSFSPRFADLVAPEPAPLMAPIAKVPLAAKGASQPVRVIMGTPVIALHQETQPPQPKGTPIWFALSAILLWAATIAGAWVLRVDLYELIGL